MILAAVLLKLGTYGFVRIAIPILPEAAVEWAPWIGLLAVIGIIYGALGCLAQTDMKRLIAFSSVAHMGFVMLGIATLTDFGINAAVFGMVAHGLITGMLFFLAGSVKERFHTLEITRLGGLLAPGAAAGLDPRLLRDGVARPARPGRVLGRVPRHPRRPTTRPPGLSEELFRAYMVVAAVGTVLAAGYLLWLLQRTAFGTPKEEFADQHIHDVHVPEWIAWVPMLVLILVSASTRTSSSRSPTAASRTARRCRGAGGCWPCCALLLGVRPRRRRLPRASRPRSSSPARSSCVLLADLSRRSATGR